MRHYTDGPDSSAGEIIERPVGNVRERAVAIIDPLNDELHNMLPAGIKLERYKSAFLTAVLRDRDILTCDAPSIRLALLKCANDGLVPDGRQAALVRFGTTCTYMPMVAGILARAHELGDLLGVNAQCVHEKDVFRCNLADVNDTHHEAPPLGEHRGFVVGAYAIFRNPQGLGKGGL
jgi:recombination protein RecT